MVFDSTIAPLGRDLRFFDPLHRIQKRKLRDCIQRIPSVFEWAFGRKRSKDFFLYVSTEENWSQLKTKVIRESPPNFKSSVHYWSAIYLFMERALVFGESDLLIEWGKEFQKFGKQSPKYNDALLLYGLGLMDLKNESEAKKVFLEIESNSPSKHVLSQLEEIKSSGK